MLLPQSRGELSDTCGGVLPDPLQHIDEVGVDVDLVQATGGDQALHNADLLGAELGPAEIPVFPAHGNYPQRALQVIRIDGHVRVTQEYLELYPAIADVFQCLGKGRGRREPVLPEPLVHPVEERLHVRLAVRQAMQALDLAGEVFVPDLLLDGVDRADALEPIAHSLGVGSFGLEQLPSRVGLIGSAG